MERRQQQLLIANLHLIASSAIPKAYRERESADRSSTRSVFAAATALR